MAGKLPELTEEDLKKFGLLDSAPIAPTGETFGDLPKITDEDVKNLEKSAADRKKFGDSPGTEFALSAADSATFSLAGRFLNKAGLVSKEDQAKYAEYNPGAETAGAVAGIVAPALATLGTSVPASAAEAAAGIGAKQIAKMGVQAAAAPAIGAMELGNAAEKTILALTKDKIKREVVRKSIAKATGGAVEGALFSTGQLAREDALGTREFNAENLRDAAGTGAIYGGLIGGAMPIAGEAVSNVGKTARKVASEISARYGNRGAAALEISGFRSAADKLKFETNPFTKGKSEEIADFLQHDVDLLKNHTTDKIITRIDDIKKSTADNISQVMDTVDAQIPIAQPGVKARQAATFNTAANNIHNILDEVPKIGANKSIIKGLVEVGSEMRKLAKSDSAHSLQELWSLRKSLDRPLKDKFGQKIFSDEIKRAQFEARRVVQDEILNYTNTLDPQLGKDLADQFKRYNIASIVGKQMLKNPLKNDLALQFSDYIVGGAAALAHSPIPLVFQAAKKFMESDLKRKLIVMSKIELANSTVTKKIGSAIKDFVDVSKAYTKNARPASVTALVNSSLARKREDGKKSEAPKNKKEAFSNVRSNLSQLQADPEQLMQRIARAGSFISKDAPETATAVGEGLIKAIQFLATKIPKDPSSGVYIGKKHEYQPSSLELAKFERYLQVVEQPTSVLEDLKNGTLTREHVEALAAVYPDMYNRIRMETLTAVKEDTDMPYGKRVQLGLLLNIPTDPSLTPLSVMQLQAGFAEEAAAAQERGGAVNTTVGGTKEISAAERSASDADAFLQRRQEG